MRLSVVLCTLIIVACSTTPSSVQSQSNEPMDRCSVSDCFNHLQVREVEVIDSTAVVLYVGGQRCPFYVEFSGTFCDLTFLPGNDIVWRTARQRQINTRICSNDRHIGIDEGPFSTASGGETLPGQLPCEILDVVSLTDDQLIELYVDYGVAPPPPFGGGQIRAPEDEGEEGDATEDAADPAAQQPTAAVTDR